MRAFRAVVSGGLLLLCCGFNDGGCGGESGDKEQAVQQQRLTDEAGRQIGMPGLANFTEKKIMRRLYEMRDKNVATYTYMVDMQGRLHHVCDSMGYGLPYSTQFSNPERPAQAWETHESGNLALPQAEPNGLYMPASAEGTWVICASTKGEFTPMYIEPRVIVSPFRLNAVDDYALAGNTNDALTKQELHSRYVPAVK
jgi:hypothetical protein